MKWAWPQVKVGRWGCEGCVQHWWGEGCIKHWWGDCVRAAKVRMPRASARACVRTHVSQAGSRCEPAGIERGEMGMAAGEGWAGAGVKGAY